MWVPVNNYEGVYKIHPSGLVMRETSGRVLAIAIRGGYPTVHLCKNGVRTRHLLHRLVAKQFVEGYLPMLVVNHKDGNPLNNDATNLEWVTQKENIRHSWDCLGRRNSRAKYVLDLSTGIYYDTIKDAAAVSSYSYQSIRFKLTGRWPNNTSFIIS